MIKHALNAFLATSVTFINEVATLCEAVGADAKEVERGLKSDRRIGRGAYLSPGGAFAGGTLARDIAFLQQVGRSTDRATPLLSSVRDSNESHKAWPRQKLRELLRVADFSGKTIAVLGLTYKPQTDTLRRSSALELCRWLAGHGALVRAHDPAIRDWPTDPGPNLILCQTAEEALVQADALVVATEWPVYRDLRADRVVAAMRSPVVVDPNRFLSSTLGCDPRVRYAAVGHPSRTQ
jgi:UDPglucose 6-dehydrogenase